MHRLLAVALVLIALLSASARTGIAAAPDGAPPPGARHAGARDPLTLKQAWRLALGVAQRHWSGKAVMAELISVDAAGDTVRSGRNGRRRAWIATLASPGTAQGQLVERIVDGKVVAATAETVPATAPPMRVAPRVDSPAAIRLALRARPGVGPGRANEHGYGFEVHVDRPGVMVIEVIGSYRNHPAQVDVGAQSGRLLGTLIYTVPSRLVYSPDAGRHWHMSNLHAGFVAGIASAASGVGYAVQTAVRAVRLWRTRDGGRSWRVVSALPHAAGTDARAVVDEHLPKYGAVVAVGTNSGVWYSPVGGATWRRCASLPAGYAQWMAPGWLGNRRALLASIVTVPGGGAVYASADLHTWRQIVPEADRLSTSVDGTATIAFSGNNPGVAFLNTQHDAARRLLLPLPALSAAGQFGSGGVELAEAPGRVMRSGDGGSHWRTTLDQREAGQSLDQVAVGPSFSADGIALTAGFNGGLFRSADAGKNWTRVRSFRVPISDEVGPITFLSTSAVVAVATGPGGWRAFPRR